MDVIKIISSDGYKFEDLTEENQRHIKWLQFLVEDIEGRKYEYADTSEDGLLNKLYNEIARDVLDDVITYAKIQVAEYQITMIENQDDADV